MHEAFLRRIRRPAVCSACGLSRFPVEAVKSAQIALCCTVHKTVISNMGLRMLTYTIKRGINFSTSKVWKQIISYVLNACPGLEMPRLGVPMREVALLSPVFCTTLGCLFHRNGQRYGCFPRETAVTVNFVPIGVMATRVMGSWRLPQLSTALLSDLNFHKTGESLNFELKFIAGRACTFWFHSHLCSLSITSHIQE